MPFDSAPEMPVSDIERLVNARSLISGGGVWIKGRYRDGDRRCLIATLGLVSGNDNVLTPNSVQRRLARLLVHQLPPNAPLLARTKLLSAECRLILFNDSAKTELADVVCLFDRAIGRLVGVVPT